MHRVCWFVAAAGDFPFFRNPCSALCFKHLMVFQFEEADIDFIWEDFSVSISYGWRRRWVMVDDVDWGRSRMDLTDWRRRVLLHDRQWVVVPWSA